MTDNGLTALAAAPNVPGCYCDRDDDSNEDGPIRLCDMHEKALRPLRWDTLASAFVDFQAAVVADAATIATLRAALDGLVEAAGWHLDNANRPNEGHVRLRAALATAYAATCSAESDQQVSATKEAGK